MKPKPSQAAVFFLVSLLVFPLFAPCLEAQTAPPPPSSAAPPPMPTAQELDQLLAPIALYPDSLLAQITTASTNPQEILDVDNWLAQNSTLTGAALTDAAQKQGFDPAFISLVTFPQVIQMMAEHIDDYAAIGEAFTADQGAVTASIQRLRGQAYQAGSLRSTPQQQVQVDQAAGAPNYVIQPANPDVVYVPEYDPTVVYEQPSSGALLTTSVLSFGVGIGIGALLVGNQPWGWGGWGWNWGGRGVYYNHGPWGGWRNGYRPSNPWYRPRPVVYHNRPGYGGNWGYRPRNYRPPSPNRRPSYSRPGTRPGTRPGSNRPGGSNPGYNRPGGSRPGGTTPGYNRPGGNRPGGTEPGNNRPGGNRPGTTQPGNNRPGYNRPGTSNPSQSRPGTRPATPGQQRPSPGMTRPTNPGQQRPSPSQQRPSTRPTSPQRPSQPQSRPAPRPGGNSRPQGGSRPSPSQGRPSNSGRPQGSPR